MNEESAWLNEEKNLTGKNKMISRMSASDVSHVVSFGLLTTINVRVW